MSIDFLISLFWAILLSLITIISHILISSLVIFSNLYINIKKFFEECKNNSDGHIDILEIIRGLSKKELIDFLEKIWNQLETVEKLRRTIFTWGMDLSLLAFSIDFVVLAAWLLNKEDFLFFSRFNNGGTNIETAVHVSSVKPTIPLCISFCSHAGRVLH